MFKAFLTISSLFAIISLNSTAFAQIRGGSSTEFFQQGQDQMDREIQRIENQREGEEENLEQTLKIKQPESEDIEEMPDNPESIDHNVPESTEQEIEIKPN